MTPVDRLPGGNASLGALYAALAAGRLPGRLPARPKRRDARHWRAPDGAKLLRDGLGRKRYRKRVRVDGRKLSRVTR